MNQKGFTLIESLVGSAVFLLVALSAYGAFGVLMDAVSASRAKIAATTLANEKFEIIRNLPYTDVGIIGGLPVGKIVRTQTIVRDNFSFVVETSIRSVDDTFDGTIGGNPTDTSPADYKLVDLDITCPSCKIFSPLSFTTLVAPHALETASTNGALFIRVFDAEGLPIPSASIHLVNIGTNPDTIIDEVTDIDGWLKIVDAPVGTNAYNIVATKSGFTQDQTYPIGGVAGTDPNNPDPTVVLQQVTQASLIIDRVSVLNVSTVNTACVAIPNIDFSLTGTKTIGAPTVLKYPTQDFATDTSGNYIFSDLEWDTYSMSLGPSSYNTVGTTLPSTWVINPNENLDMRVVLALPLDATFVVSVKDSDNNPVDGAVVRLQKDEFDETKTTNSGTCAILGKVFWSGLESGTYTLTVSKAGYTTYTNNSLSISSSWQNQDIILTP